MKIEYEYSLKRLLNEHISRAFGNQGFSYDLQKQYSSTDQLVYIGTGAFKRLDTVGLYALQTQANNTDKHKTLITSLEKALNH